MGDWRVLSGMIFVARDGWRGAPDACGPPTALHNRWERWSGMGVLARMMAGLATEADAPKTIRIDATFLKAHRTASSLPAREGGRGRLIGRTKGGRAGAWGRVAWGVRCIMDTMPGSG